MRKIWFILASMSAVACLSLTTLRQPLAAAENLPPCVEVSTNKHCNSPGGPGSASITHVGVWSPVCLGEMVYAWADITNVAARVVTVVNYTPAGTNCPPDVDVRPELVPYTVTWTVNGPGDFFAQGEGEDAQFTPTTNGTGTITFYLSYSNSPPCTGTDSDSKSAQFVVNQITKFASCDFFDAEKTDDESTNARLFRIEGTLKTCCQDGADIVLELRAVPVADGRCEAGYTPTLGGGETGYHVVTTVGQFSSSMTTSGSEQLEDPGEPDTYNANSSPLLGRYVCIYWSVSPSCELTLSLFQGMRPEPGHPRICP